MAKTRVRDLATVTTILGTDFLIGDGSGFATASVITVDNFLTSYLLANDVTMTGALLAINNNSPKIELRDLNSSSGEQRYRLFTVNDRVALGFYSDGGGAATDAFAFYRDGINYEKHIINSLSTKEGSISLDDDAELVFDTGVAGFGSCQIGDNQEWADFCFTSAGVVTLKQNSTNVVNTDTDTNLCIYDAGSGIAIKNRLGATLTLNYRVSYS